MYLSLCMPGRPSVLRASEAHQAVSYHFSFHNQSPAFGKFQEHVDGPTSFIKDRPV